MFKTIPHCFLNKLKNFNSLCRIPKCYRNLYLTSLISKSAKNDDDDGNSNKKRKVPGAVLSKYEAFRDDRAPIILDVEEERRMQLEGLHIEQDDNYEIENPFEGISPHRGIEGVIDLPEAVEILQRENAENIFVVEIPKEYQYVKYIIVVSGKSVRHMLGMAEFMRRVYKYKRSKNDAIPTLEGKGSRDWIALDMGNIALHIFSRNKRLEYDLESLWSVGREYDEICNQPEHPTVALLKQHTVLLKDLTPADTRLPDNCT